MICENCGHEQKITVTLPSPEARRAMQEMISQNMRDAFRRVWQETPWRTKMRMRWNRLKHVWNPAWLSTG